MTGIEPNRRGRVRPALAIGLVLLLLLLALPGLAQSAPITIVYTTPDGVFIWSEDDPAPAQILNTPSLMARLSPDAASVVMVTEASGFPDAIWLSSSGGAATPLVTSEEHIDGAAFGQVEWAGNDTLYFNTSRFESPLGATPRNDLWRVTASSREITQLREPGVGGAFTLNPEGTLLTLTVPGDFDADGNPRTDGVIRLYDPAADTAEIALAFAPVATASPFVFYPPISWRDGAFLAAIPPSDLVYTPGPTLLWRISPDGSSEQVGTVADMSFFAIPRWDAAAEYLFYGAEGPDNQLILHLAKADGTAPEPIGTAARAYDFRWANQGNRFLLRAETTENRSVIGTPDDPTGETLPLEVMQTAWAGGERLVYTLFGTTAMPLMLWDDGTTTELTTLPPGSRLLDIRD